MLLADSHHQRADVVLHKDARNSMTACCMVYHSFLENGHGVVSTCHPLSVWLRFVFVSQIDYVFLLTHPLSHRKLVRVCRYLVRVQSRGHHCDEVLEHLVVWGGIAQQETMNVLNILSFCMNFKKEKCLLKKWNAVVLNCASGAKKIVDLSRFIIQQMSQRLINSAEKSIRKSFMFNLLLSCLWEVQ